MLSNLTGAKLAVRLAPVVDVDSVIVDILVEVLNDSEKLRSKLVLVPPPETLVVVVAICGATD